MPDPADAVGPSADFLRRHPGTVEIGGDAGEPAVGTHPAVLVTAHDEADLRARTWPALRSEAIGVLLGPGAGALTFDPGGDLPLTAFWTRREPRHRWCELRFAGPVDVADVLTRLARQSVGHDRGRLPVRTQGAEPGPLLLDERVHNPAGFQAAATGPVRDLADLPARVDRAVVDRLRDVRGVRVTEATARERAQGVVALALAGVPLVADLGRDGGATVGALGRGVVTAMTAAVDLDDPLAREEHSVVLRRAALDAHAAGWSRRPQPSVSVVLATRRPDMIEHAVAQVARQRGVARLELVLAPHGFAADRRRVRELLPDHVALQFRGQSEHAVFGDVLQAAYLASGGDVVLKMDDDDWYGPETVVDLLRARAYSGAGLVGAPAAWVHVTGRDVTAVRRHTGELHARFVAGGTMMVDRPLLREVGGFRSVRRFVDAQLLGAVQAAGAGIYRIHGLGYVLRRTPSGHTWEIGDDALLDDEAITASWPGFRPSRLMELG